MAEMKKSLPDLIVELDALDRKLQLARLQEGRAISASALSLRVPASTRQRVHQALAALPGRRGLSQAEYRTHLLAGVRGLARAWDGGCLSDAY